MTILIQSRKGFNWNITIGRHLSWSSQVDLITVVKEWRTDYEVDYAEFVKGFFRKK